jgi:hypothetical protein
MHNNTAARLSRYHYQHDWQTHALLLHHNGSSSALPAMVNDPHILNGIFCQLLTQLLDLLTHVSRVGATHVSTLP